MTKRLIILIASLVLVVPFVFYGCSGDDGAAGAPGINGTNGAPGAAGSGSLAKETCVVCHGVGKELDVAAVHDVATGGLHRAGTATVTINSLVFGAANSDNVIPVAVNFDVVAVNDRGGKVRQGPASADTTNLDLTTNSTSSGITSLTYIRFYLAELIPGNITNKDPNEWFDYTNSHNGRTVREPNALTFNSYNISTNTGNYTYRFLDNTTHVDNAIMLSGADNVYNPANLHRVGIQMSSLPVGFFTTSDMTQSSPYVNATFDNVPGGGTPAATKEDSSNAACFNCHATNQAIAHGSRYQYKYCVLCHNPTLPTNGDKSGNLAPFIHKIHTSQDNAGLGQSFAEITYPQDVRNCVTCHTGGTNGLDNNAWNTKPSIEACGACHSGGGKNYDGTPIPGVNFATGAGHGGGIQTTNAGCAGCHPPTGILSSKSVTQAHAAENGVPTNPTPGRDVLGYFLDNVAVDNTNHPVVTFHFTVSKDGGNTFSPLTIPVDNAGKATLPTGYTSGSPGFLLAFAMPQDNVSAPADYNNLGAGGTAPATGRNGQPQSVNLTGLTLTGTPAAYTATLTTATFPPGSKMRAIALQGAWNQTVAGVGDIELAHFSVLKAVTGDAVRRTIVESGYLDNAGKTLTDPALFLSAAGRPVGCLECHKVFLGHGGSRVSNVQVCVVCHNPNMTSGGRTIPDNVAINPEIVAVFGNKPLTYPEVPNNFKDLIHGLHSAESRTTKFIDLRNRQEDNVVGLGVIVRGDEITYPGNLKDCSKCHIDTTTSHTYLPSGIPAAALNTTEKITTGNANETRADIIAARNTVPNQTDLVSSPTTAVCGRCHNSGPAMDHFRLNGGDAGATRSVVNQAAAPFSLMPAFDLTP